MVRNRVEGEIKKGPWTAEEDEILRNFINENGPKDWSSIRSKGLLPRTGKSCRLRWVNKLQPNLKKGCKFSAEEERLVLELQGVVGNKWAAIATYLPGRTDNDVKNFWSTRQKKLARILRLSSQPNKALKKGGKATVMDEGPSSLQTVMDEGPSSLQDPNQEKPAPLNCGICSCLCSENFNVNVVNNLAPLPHSFTPYPLDILTNSMQTGDFCSVSNCLPYPYEQMGFTNDQLLNATISNGVRPENQADLSNGLDRSYSEFPTPVEWTPALTPALNCVGPALPLPLMQEMHGFPEEQNFMEGYTYQEDFQLGSISEQPNLGVPSMEEQLEATDQNYADSVVDDYRDNLITMPQDTFDDFPEDMLDDSLERAPKSSSS